MDEARSIVGRPVPDGEVLDLVAEESKKQVAAAAEVGHYMDGKMQEGQPQWQGSHK